MALRTSSTTTAPSFTSARITTARTPEPVLRQKPVQARERARSLMIRCSQAPKRQVTTIQAVEGGVKNVTDIVDAEGKTIHYEFTAIYDGKDYPVTGDPVRDAVSIKKVDDYTFEVTNKKAGKIVNTVRAAY